jgi:antitoxin PrlF
MARSSHAGGVTESDDPVLVKFLTFLARDIADHPQRFQAVDEGLVKRIESLVLGVEVDFEKALRADNE